MQINYDFLLSQGVGAPSEPVVEVGEEVKRGQLIAKCPEGKLGQNIHASIYGVVESIDDKKITIKANEEQDDKFVELTSTEPIDLVREAGIVGLGGAGFPTHVKLGKPFEKGGVLLINAAECEPILDHNMRYINENAEYVVKSVKTVMNMVNAEKAIIGIKSLHTEEIAKLEAAIDCDNITIHGLENMYPMGEERALIREALGTLLNVTDLPLAADAIVINLETLYRIQEAIEFKKPLIDKDMTVAGLINGENVKTFRNVPIGTKVSEMIERAGGLATEEYGEIIMGGPFTGKRTTLDSPVVKTTGGIIVTNPFWKAPEKMGLLVCACGGNKERLEQLAESMGAKEIVGVEYCKQAIEMKNGSRKCENPGHCPGQVQKVMNLKRAGAEAILISNCTDCSNTVMSCAPQLKVPVFHCTDAALRSVGMMLIRKIKK